MPIASVGSSNFPQVTLPSAATGATASAKPDTDAPAASAKTAAAPDTDGDASKGASTSDAKSGGSSVGESMFKINPDGTMGPLHMPRPGHVTHA